MLLEAPELCTRTKIHPRKNSTELTPPTNFRQPLCFLKLPLAQRELLFQRPWWKSHLWFLIPLGLSASAWGARCVSIGDLLILGFIRARRRHFQQNLIVFKFCSCTMTTLLPPKLVENKFSRTSRLSRLVLHKKLSRVDFSKLQTIGWIASNSNFTVACAYLCPVHLWCKIASGA